MKQEKVGDSLKTVIDLAQGTHCNPSIGIEAMVRSIGPIVATALGTTHWEVEIVHGDIKVNAQSNNGIAYRKLGGWLGFHSDKHITVGDIAVWREERFSEIEIKYIDLVADLINLIFVEPFFGKATELNNELAKLPR